MRRNYAILCKVRQIGFALFGANSHSKLEKSLSTFLHPCRRQISDWRVSRRMLFGSAFLSSNQRITPMPGLSGSTGTPAEVPGVK
ncbi:hypothetical protein RJ641_023691 [Dillenia turbinata]|uniref:Uncharacterized protein n=1 Tax=Dillenia turbinata TaxID=194707 RepID=A0AAN8YVW5_9MAGN